jgi:hypothetical protein
LKTIPRQFFRRFTQEASSACERLSPTVAAILYHIILWVKKINTQHIVVLSEFMPVRGIYSRRSSHLCIGYQNQARSGVVRNRIRKTGQEINQISVTFFGQVSGKFPCLLGGGKSGE